jgi:hypothetical protein
MKSKLLQKKSDCLNKSREGLDGQQENTEDSSEPQKVREKMAATIIGTVNS